MYSNIINFYATLNDHKRVMQIKWIELATEQSGDLFDDALVKVVKPVEQYV